MLAPTLEAETAMPNAPSALGDDQLMLAYAAGDPAAFDVLYARYENALYRFVKRMLGLRLAPEVDEVFQDTWLRIVSARASFSSQGAAWRTWAFTIAHNLAMDRLRVSGREVQFYAHDEEGDGLEAGRLFSRGLLNEGALPSDAAHPSAEEGAFWRAAGRRLLACLDELPDDQRAAFLLHHGDGFSVEALADALDTHCETVKSRLHDGIKKLREGMERYLPVLRVGR